MICIYAVAEVKPGCERQFLKAAESLINYSRAEAGNISYHLAKEMENHFVFMELWRDEEACRVHMAAPHFIEAGKQFESFLSAPLDIHQMEGII